MDKIIHDNFLSEGMVGRLADAKKNTIQGLWYQLTCMFAEDGIRAFEGLEKPIRDMLSGLIGWLKTPEAAEMMKKMGKDIMDILKTLKDMTMFFVHAFGPMEKFIMGFLKMQMYMQAVIIPIKLLRSAMSVFGMFGGYTREITRMTMALGGLRNAGYSTISFLSHPMQNTRSAFSKGGAANNFLRSATGFVFGRSSYVPREDISYSPGANMQGNYASSATQRNVYIPPVLKGGGTKRVFMPSQFISGVGGMAGMAVS